MGGGAPPHYGTVIVIRDGNIYFLIFNHLLVTDVLCVSKINIIINLFIGCGAIGGPVGGTDFSSGVMTAEETFTMSQLEDGTKYQDYTY